MVENEEEEVSDSGERGDSPFPECELVPDTSTASRSSPPAAVSAAVDEGELRRLLACVVDQDQQALASIYDRLASRVYHLALRIAGRAALAEEVVEDTFWQVWRQAPRFDAERGSAIAWIMTIARSRALDARRAEKSVQAETGSEDLDRVPANLPDPADWIGALQDGQRLRQALSDLDALPLQLVALAFFRGLSHDEIAVQTSLPLGTVKSQIRRALLKLKQVLSADDTSP
ncbi:sigma-70 family RNA polymerase sigma factor [Methylococcus sp. EFPC2]|nr:sigma-70 family RNA polymerase sigma factor [Methylococcus sp. EFPC2]